MTNLTPIEHMVKENALEKLVKVIQGMTSEEIDAAINMHENHIILLCDELESRGYKTYG